MVKLFFLYTLLGVPGSAFIALVFWGALLIYGYELDWRRKSMFAALWIIPALIMIAFRIHPAVFMVYDLFLAFVLMLVNNLDRQGIV